MNIALIFAGGTGQRMHTESLPKQFLELHGKPIIVYTLEQFNEHKDIDGIIVVCLENWIPYLRKLTQKYMLDKVISIVRGGSSGQESIFNGLQEAHRLYADDAVILIHDGVRPLVDDETISNCIKMVEKNGSAITVTSAIETVTRQNISGEIVEVYDRSTCKFAKAPQCFHLGELYRCHEKANSEGKRDFIDSASMYSYYGGKLCAVEGKRENIKITTPMDFYLFRAIIDAKENSQIFGL